MDKTLTVSEYCEILNEKLMELKAKIIGEVSDFKEWQTSGHAYFSLKDENDESLLNCAMWKSNYALSGIRVENGIKVIAIGKPKVFKNSGRLSFIVDALELVGEGALKKHYDELKLKLTREGLFLEEKKRLVPRFAHHIGVITSARGAVIHDFQNNLGRHGFHIKFVDSLVEGQEAIRDLILSVKTLSKQKIDVLVIMRGGGSLQSLAAFNNEVLIREIAKFPVPVIAGIGHHQDIPLLALASDLSVSTPTAAANSLNKPWEEVNREIEGLRYKILSNFRDIIREKVALIEDSRILIKEAFKRIVTRFKQVENIIPVNIQRLEDEIISKRKKLFDLKNSVIIKNKKLLEQTFLQIQNLEKQINLNNPQRLLSLGYVIAMKGDKIVKSINNVIIGDALKMLMSDGQVATEVKSINGKK